MSVSKPILKDAVPAGADLTGALFKFVQLNSSGQAILPGTAGNEIYGVVSNEPKSSAVGTPLTVDVFGIVKVVAGGTVATGARVMANTSGQAVTATTGLNVAGIARKGGASGEIIEVLLTHSYQV
jgi:hypothetical protein